MKSITIEIPDGKKAEWQNGVLTLVDDKPKDVTERIKTFDDACDELGGLENALVKEYFNTGTCESTKDLLAYLKCRVICAALNEGWENPQDCKTPVFYAWYWLYDHEPTYEEMYSYEIPVDADMAKYGLPAGRAVARSYHSPSGAEARIGSRLCFKTCELAKYAAQQFADIFLDFLLIQK